MELLKNFFKNRDVQYFLIFCLVILTAGFTIYPLFSESPPTQTANEQTTIASTDSPTDTSTSQAPVSQVVQVAFATGTQSAKIYTTPDAKEFPIAELTNGQFALILHAVNDQWLQIQYNGQVAWLDRTNTTIGHLMSVYQENAIIYENPSTTSKVLETIPYGELLFSTGEANQQFEKVRHRDVEGYVVNDQLNFAVDQINELYKSQAGLPQILDSGKILLSKLNETPVYSSADAFSSTLVTVASGTTFNYEDRDGDFYKVTLSNNQTGYIPYWLVTANFAAIETDLLLPQGIANATIVIDPGHGGDDPGAVVDFSPVHEADYTLSTALLVQKELENLGARVILTRSTDTSVSLAQRAQISNQEKANAFISLHFDSGPQATVSGTTGYFYSTISENLALTVDKYIARNLPIRSQGTKFQNYMVLRENTQPSMLLELGYLNNPDDNKQIASAEYQQNIATSIANALKEYFQ